MTPILELLTLLAIPIGLLILVLGAACIQSAERMAEDDPRWNELAGKREEEELKKEYKGR